MPKNPLFAATHGRCALALAAGVALVSLPAARASVSYATAGSTYSQNFDSLPNTPVDLTLGNSPVGWTDDNVSPAAGNFSIPGWYFYHPLVLAEGGANSHQRMRIGAGGATTGAFMSYGASGTTERALGDLGSNTLGAVGADIYVGLRLTNDTGQALDSFTVTYTGEQWRDGGSATPNAQSMTFMWSTSATAISDPNTSFTLAPTLNFTSPTFVNAGGGAALDGNAAANRTTLSATINSVGWASGTDLWLRWSDISNTGNDHALSVDDFSFTAAAVPEPTSLGLVAIGALALARRRRR